MGTIKNLDLRKWNLNNWKNKNSENQKFSFFSWNYPKVRKEEIV
jgi:hypothetical protein